VFNAQLANLVTVTKLHGAILSLRIGLRLAIWALQPCSMQSRGDYRQASRIEFDRAVRKDAELTADLVVRPFAIASQFDSHPHTPECSAVGERRPLCDQEVATIQPEPCAEVVLFQPLHGYACHRLTRGSSGLMPGDASS